jgi:hypothetical protein
MDQILARATQIVYVIVPLVFFMAWVYLAFHMVFARVITDPRNPALWFFSVVTGPLTRPVRALLPPAATESRVRVVSLGVYVALWLLSRVTLAALIGPAGG